MFLEVMIWSAKVRDPMKERTIERIQKPFSYCTAETFYMKNTLKN